MKEGKGVFFCVNGSRYEGEWMNDKKEGKGIESFPSGAKY